MDKNFNNPNNEQTKATLDWLENNFYARPGVSISRSSLYSMYGTFCQSNNFRPMCKATFGKLIRLQFPFVTSKRLGARGQSKYHYYGIAMKYSLQHNKNKNDCEFDKPLSRFSKNATTINQSDYHTILQSIFNLNYKIEKGPLLDDKAIFINIYKIHCQCLIDAALSDPPNYSQMRHYIIHFWQQLPQHVKVDLDILVNLDKKFYTTLEDIHLKLDSDFDQLKHIYAIATLNPLWLNKAMENCYSNIKEIKLNEAIKWKAKIKKQFHLIVMAKSIDLSQLHQTIHVLKKLNYDELILFNDSTLQSFVQLINNIGDKSLSIENLIDSIDYMIKWCGKIFCKELALGFCQLQSYIMKKLTQSNSPFLMSSHILLTFIIDYIINLC